MIKFTGLTSSPPRRSKITVCLAGIEQGSESEEGLEIVEAAMGKNDEKQKQWKAEVEDQHRR